MIAVYELKGLFCPQEINFFYHFFFHIFLFLFRHLINYKKFLVKNGMRENFEGNWKKQL